MYLAIDAGNTNMVFALCDGSEIVKAWRCRTDAHRTGDEYISWLWPLFKKEEIAFSAVNDVIIGSVVPDAAYHLTCLCQTAWDIIPDFVDHTAPDIPINLPNPREVGADRLINALAARNKYGAPGIIIDFGTATTFDVIDQSGAYCGGVIAPGINLSLGALEKAAAKLPRVEIKKPSQVIGTDTVSAMQSGIFWGYTGLIEGLIARLSAELQDGKKPYIIATGGLAPLFEDDIADLTAIEPDLTLHGLIAIHQGQS